MISNTFALRNNGEQTTKAMTEERYIYPYGGPWGDISTYQGLQPFKYNGKELDRVHGLDWYDYGARRYDPAFGSFLSPDPYVQAPDFTQNFNRYSYCLNNPLKWYYTPDHYRTFLQFKP